MPNAWEKLLRMRPDGAMCDKNTAQHFFLLELLPTRALVCNEREGTADSLTVFMVKRAELHDQWRPRIIPSFIQDVFQASE